MRDIGLRGQPDADVLAAAHDADEIVITRDRGFTFGKGWPQGSTAGLLFVNLPDDTSADEVNGKIVDLLTQRLPVSLLGAVTIVETSRALSRTVRRRP